VERGTARCAAARSGGGRAAGGGCRSLGKAGRLASGELTHHGTGAQRCAPDAHAARMGGEVARKGVDGPRGDLTLTGIAHLR